MTDDFRSLVRLVAELVDAQAGQRIESGQEWMNDAQALSMKLFRHAISLETLSQSSSITGTGQRLPAFVDYGSINLITRAAAETYLVFFHIYRAGSHSASVFRHAAWRLGGLLDRQTYHATTPERLQLLERESREIEEIRASIRLAPPFHELTPKQQKQLLSGAWKIGRSWGDLASSAGLHARYFDSFYSHLCGYSHASYLSTLQIRQSWHSCEDQARMAGAAIAFTTVILSHFVFAYTQVFSTARAALDAQPGAAALARKWHLRTQDLARHYGE